MAEGLLSLQCRVPGPVVRVGFCWESFPQILRAERGLPGRVPLSACPQAPSPLLTAGGPWQPWHRCCDTRGLPGSAGWDSGGATVTPLLRHSGSASEVPSRARGAVLGQGTAGPSLCIAAPRGQTGLVCVPCGGFCSQVLSPALQLVMAGGNREGWLRSHGVLSFLLLSRGSLQASGSPGPKLGPALGQTPCGELESASVWRREKWGAVLPSPRLAPLLALLEVWQHREDRNWSCKSFWSDGAPVATAVLRGQEGAEELVCNGEVRAVSSYEVANGERKENKALQEGTKEKAGERKGGEGAQSRGRDSVEKGNGAWEPSAVADLCTPCLVLGPGVAVPTWAGSSAVLGWLLTL